jgi:predicted ATP-dependent protease
VWTCQKDSDSGDSGQYGAAGIRLTKKDLVDVPEEAKQKLKFVPVETVDEVLAVALEKDGAVPASETKSA